MIWAGLALGIITAVSGFRNALRLMDRTTREGKKKAPPPPSFNDHF